MRSLGVILPKLAYAVGMLLAVVVLNFLLLQIAPGDIADTIIGEMGGATPEMEAEIRASYGLDRPLAEQLLVYVGNVAQGDLGYSYYFNRPVLEVILHRVPATLLLVVAALLFAILVGTFLGVVAARRPNGWFSHVVTVLALVGYSAPVFWTGLMLLILFASVLPVFPVSGMVSPVFDGGPLARAVEVAHHLVLPALTLGIIYLAQYSRLSRASMLDVLGADYIRTARAKGLAERVVVYKHALRNAILPVVTIAGLQFGQLFAGAVLVETVFNWPGMGLLAYDSILRRDTPTIMGVLFFSALLVIVANMLTDLAYRLIDPRIRGRA
ncbi:ABC transporter permease [Marinibaculum pumilum]|uniref:ABC transporter permease n=1 Tax=Marinibaculum pumilum TaxID=1766165 RepID=A0ABV7L9T8_9PROT